MEYFVGVFPQIKYVLLGEEFTGGGHFDIVINFIQLRRKCGFKAGELIYKKALQFSHESQDLVSNQCLWII